MDFSKIRSTQVRLVLNFLTESISAQYHVVFDDIISTVDSSTANYTEVWISLVTSMKSIIQVMSYQEYDLELDYERLTADGHRISFSEYIYRIVGRAKGEESISVQGHPSSDEDLFVREKVPRRTERPSVRKPGINGNDVPIGQAQNYGSIDNSQ